VFHVHTIQRLLGQKYNIDLGPTLARWAKEPDWRYRFAEWIVHNDGAALRRPFAEVLPEIDIT
jgi:hypothetical protein